MPGLSAGNCDLERDYWNETQQPLASLLFLLPLLIGYEAALVVIGEGAVGGLRNGADAWMRGWLLQAGVRFPWVLPVGIVVGLLGWHLVRRDSWTCRAHTLLGMLSESLLFALVLILAGQTLHVAFGKVAPPAALCANGLTAAQIRTISYLGAGLYEESLFRLALLPALYGLGRLLRLHRGLAGALAVAASSVIFAAAHYLPADSSALSPMAYVSALDAVRCNATLWFGFLFRGLAGMAFGTLFLLRGFGVTVGSHALYDMLVGFMASLTV